MKDHSFYWLLLAATFFMGTNHAQAQYDEKYRPQFHLSSKSSSMADPKGLYLFDGKYHLFWYGQWEHAVSTDLVHWTEQPKPMKGAPRPFSYFSGSVVVDRNNTGGFGKDSKVAVYTIHYPGDSLPETQGISFSNDGGKQFNYYDQNPVLDINKKYFRDPQVFWYQPTRMWKMVVALPDLHQIPIYESSDLKNWKYCSSFGNLGAKNSFWECPDFFELPVQGVPGLKKWVMIIGRGPNKVQYFVGSFDGKTFVPDVADVDYLKNGKGVKGLLFDDFESSSFTKWKFEGDAFKNSPDTMGAIDFLGKAYAGNFAKRRSTGIMKSTTFRIAHHAINFLLAGGMNNDSLRFQLVCEGKVCRSATGDNTNVFRWNGWDVRELSGKEAHLEIIDSTNDSIHGAIAVDHIMFADNLMNQQTEHALWLDYGNDFYATRTWRNYEAPENSNKEPILISWVGNWKYARAVPSSWGTGFQSVPRTIALKKFPEGIRMVQEPIAGLRMLRKDSIQINNRRINGANELKEFKPTKNIYEIEAVFNTNTTAVFGFNLLVGEGRKLTLSYDPTISSLCLDRTNCTDYISNADFTKKFAGKMYAPVDPVDGKLKLHILIDQSSIEVFTNDGRINLTAATYPSSTQTGIELFSEKGSTQLLSLKAWQLASIWKNNE